MEGTLGEIRIFAGSYAPQGWLFCSGQLLPIAQYQALYSILGTSYGGNGLNTFGLPKLVSPAAVEGTSQGQYIICIQGYYPSRP